MIAATRTHKHRTDLGQATLDQVGLISAIVVLLAAVATAFGPGGNSSAGVQLANSIGARIIAAVARDASSSPAALGGNPVPLVAGGKSVAKAPSGNPDPQARSGSSVALGNTQAGGAHRRGVAVGSGSHAPRLTDLKMHEIGPQAAWRTWSAARSYSSLPSPAGMPTGLENQLTGASGTVEGALCMMCLGTSARAEYAFGGAAHAAGSGAHSTDLIGVDTLMRAHLALAHATISATEAMQGFGLRVTARTTATGTAGVDGSLAARLELGTLHQALVLEAGAVAGLAGHVEQRASIHLAGVAVLATAGADGWVGAGLTGRLHVGHDGPGKFSWDIGGGAGLGVGGGAHFAGALDLSEAMHQHPQLLARLGSSLLGLPAVSAAPALLGIAELDAKYIAPHRSTRHGART